MLYLLIKSGEEMLKIDRHSYILNELKNRGVQDILIMSVDNLKGFSEAISSVFPKTEIQKCVVHQIRNSIRYISYKDTRGIYIRLKRNI